LKKASQIGVLFLISCVSADLVAQQQPQSSYPDGVQNSSGESQNQGTVNCSDPALASSSECSSQNSGNNTSQSPQSHPPQSGTFGSPSPSPNLDYSDTEDLSRRRNLGDRSAQLQLPPEQLTEFQKFVASTTGQVLPIYGETLFRRVPSTFAPLDMTPVPPDFVIGPGDELRIRVWGQLSFQANVRVDRSGDVYLPQVGPIHVASVPFSELDTHLRSAIGRVYHNFDLTVDLGQIRSIQVYLAGRARQPGVYTVSSLSTLVNALFASGGPSTQGSLRHIELRRGIAKITDFDLYNLIAHGDKSKDVKLMAGDVIFIPPVGPQAAVIGSVRSPGIYELLPEESLTQVLADAGGVSAVASQARVSIERIEGHNGRHAMEVPYDPNGLGTTLGDGDLVHVFAIVPQYTKTVVLRGNLANPGRFAWHAGMHVSELIPDKDSLVTRNYWWKRTQLGLPAPEYEPTPDFQSLRQPVDSQPVTMRPPIQDDASVSSQSESSAQTPGSQQDRNLSAQQRGGSSSLGAQQSIQSVRVPRSAPRTEVRLLAPEIDWDYAVIERIDQDDMKTTLLPFDLGKLVLQHDASQDLELKSGDVVSVFSEADIRVPLAQQTKLVTLDGEFAHAGVYTVQPDETLRHLVERAGGITPNAYLYGSEFTRESVRTVQQARIDEYVQNLEKRIQRGNLALAASAVGSQQDLASGTATQNSERDFVASLRQLRATGRIVLEFKSNNRGTESIPDLAMENGDRFVIPPVPAVVNVVGAVYDQNSFIFSQGRTAGSYLLLAGGPTKDADQRHEFVIRANGNVVSRDATKQHWGNEFAKLRLNPGDTIVVPERTYKPSALRSVLDWSQVFSQLALGAAAINVIK
jgi:protein involved in polysaccharide export with SLBB domain